MAISDKNDNIGTAKDPVEKETLLFKDSAQGYLQTVEKEYTLRLSVEYGVTVAQWLLPMLGDNEIQSLNASAMQKFVRKLELQNVRPCGSPVRRPIPRNTLASIRALLFNIVNHGRGQQSLALIPWKDVAKNNDPERVILINPFTQRGVSRGLAGDQVTA